MKEDDINLAEWRNPENWSTRRWLGLYFSKRDSRAWVPKPYPVLGWTVNLANQRGALWAIGIVSATILMAFGAGFLAAT